MPSRSWSLLVCPFPILWLSIFGTTAQADGDSSKTCFSRPSDRWALNSLGQNPCEVAERLVSVCTGELQSLWTSVTTSGPTPEQSNDCACSTVLYSLASQCLLCQDKDIPIWSMWKQNCDAPRIRTIDTIPADTKIPPWAYMDVVSHDEYNEQLAVQYSSNTNATESSATVSSTSSAGEISSSNAPNNSGTIAGIVVGVFVFLAVIGLSLLWFLRRRRQARIAPSTAYLAEIGRHRKGPPECQRKRLIAEDQDYLAEPLTYTDRLSASVSERASVSFITT